jgi:flagellar motor switch protein FliN/FliY
MTDVTPNPRAPEHPQSDFAPLRSGEGDAVDPRLEHLLDVSLALDVELGRTRLTIQRVLALGPGSILELDKPAGEPLDVLLNGRLVARGEAVVVGDRFGVRITEIVGPRERLERLR